MASSDGPREEEEQEQRNRPAAAHEDGVDVEMAEPLPLPSSGSGEEVPAVVASRGGATSSTATATTTTARTVRRRATSPGDDDNVNSHSKRGDDGEEDDDDETIIILDPSSDESRGRHRQQRLVRQNLSMFDWLEREAAPELEERRRSILLRELRRAQRSSFVHFAILCFIPTVLLFVVLGTVFGDVDECSMSGGNQQQQQLLPQNNSAFADAFSNCYMEPRKFMNAFTTRCVCESIPVAVLRDGDDDTSTIP